MFVATIVIPEGGGVYAKRMIEQNVFLFVLYLFLGFMAGASIASFADAAASRTVAEKKWWGDARSLCGACGRTLSLADLVPFFSFLWLRGCCRTCRTIIPARHFYIECVAGIFGAAFVWKWGVSPALLFSFVALLFLLFHAVTDFLCGYIYDAWVIAMAICAIVLRFLFGNVSAVFDGMLGAGLGFCVIYLIVLLSRGGMGSGDAMLMLGTGAMLGWKMTIVALYLGFLCGGVVVIPLLVMKKVSRKDILPLGPFLAFGALLSLFAAGPLLALFGLSQSWPWN